MNFDPITDISVKKVLLNQMLYEVCIINSFTVSICFLNNLISDMYQQIFQWYHPQFYCYVIFTPQFIFA